MNIIIVFPKTEQAQSVRRILLKSGYTVDAVCSTGAQALLAANDLDSGIMICTYRLADMLYSELHEYLFPRYEMIMIGSSSQAAGCEEEGIVSLAAPLKVHELLQAVEQLADAWIRRKKKRRHQPKARSPEEAHVIGKAKRLLMEQKHLSEEEAHWYLQKHSMDNGTNLYETAQMILSLMG